MSYVPPHLRNKPQSTDSNILQNPSKKDRRPPRRTYEKTQWESKKEEEQREAEEKRKATQRSLEDTVENFPALGNSTTTSSTWKINTRKFSELASDWKTNDDNQKEREEREKVAGNKHSDVFVLPRFRRVQRFSDTEDDSPNEEGNASEKPVLNPEEEGWTLVDKKTYRKPKAERNLSDEDSVEQKHEEDDTVWAAPEEHETCWDERRY
jgi:hypothetical protein